ncbi:MAG: hypothetical protein KGM17_01020 [Sphingomonadales bacterium]|nr:hypothetical protein [Sphingomonadales bacterium]
MVMLATLRRSGGIDALSRHLDMAPADGSAAARDLLPHVLELYRDRYQAAGGGIEGVAAVMRLLEPLGGNALAFAIHQPEPIPDAQRAQVLAVLPGSAEGVAALVGEARRSSVVPAAQLEAVLPLLVMLVGGYLAARTETARGAGEDIVAEFERLVSRESGRA